MGRLSKVLVLGILVVISITIGCVTRPANEEVKNVTPQISPTVTVPPAPKHVYLEVGQLEQFNYWGHSISINYTSAYPKQIINIIVDGVAKNLQKELNESSTGLYWKEGNLSFALKPVLWETRDGQKIPFYEQTWNTTELYFEVLIGRP